MNRIAALAACSLALLVHGCFSDTTVMKLNADGSGTLTVTTLMKASAIKQMKEMAKAFGGENAKDPEFFTEKEAKDKAAKMGEDVTFVSREAIKTKDAEGHKVVYAFKDITKVKISEMSDPPGGGEGGFKTDAKKSDPITFKFAKLPGGNSLLTIVNPKMEPPKPGAEAPAPDKPAQDGEVPEEQLAMMKEMMGGLKVSIQIEVGKIVKTNSSHVQGSTVTVLEMDFDKLLGDMAKFKKLAAAQPKTPEEMKALVKDFPGVKVNLDPETTIEFAGK